MKRLLLLATLALGASLIFATAVMAQEDVPGKLEPPVMETEEAFGKQEVIETPLEEAVEEPVEEAIGADQPESKEEEAIEEKAQEQVGVTGKAEAKKAGKEGTLQVKVTEHVPLPKSGGVSTASVLLPAAALLLGSGILAYAILRRRR